jgi:hypothetical protein
MCGLKRSWTKIGGQCSSGGVTALSNSAHRRNDGDELKPLCSLKAKDCV